MLFSGNSSEILENPGSVPPNFLNEIVRAGDSGLNHVQVGPLTIPVFLNFTGLFEKIKEILSEFLKTTPKVLYFCQVSEP